MLIPDRKYLLCLLIVLVGVAFSPSLHNGFTGWDDPDFLTQNSSVKSLAPINLAAMFTRPVLGMYHPLSTLSVALEYHFFGLDPRIYHIDNLILHAINTWLVFAFIHVLTGRAGVACLTALWFGVHPLRVESVAWVVERKDVLYAGFYLWALYLYARGLVSEGGLTRAGRRVIFALFVLSVLAKPPGITLPAALLLVDRYLGRWKSGLVLREKIPYFAVSLMILGINLGTTFCAQVPGKKFVLTVAEKMFFTLYSFGLYISKILVPRGLSCIYPYPPLSNIPELMEVLAVVALGGIFILALIKGRGQKDLWFGGAFFTIHILPPLGTIWLNGFVLAERHTYLPSVGIALSMAWAVERVCKEGGLFRLRSPNGSSGGRLGSLQGWRAVTATAVAVYSLWLAVGTWQRCFVWRDSLALWSDAVRKFPHLALAHINLGMEFQGRGQNDAAFLEFQRGIELTARTEDPRNPAAYINRAVAWEKAGEPLKALADYDRAIRLQNDHGGAYFNRGRLRARLGRFDEALADLNRVMELVPLDALVYAEKGSVYGFRKNYDLAGASFNKAIELDPLLAAAYSRRAALLIDLRQLDRAMVDMNEAIRLDPDVLESYIDRGNLRYLRGDLSGALLDFDRAVELERFTSLGYLQRARILALMGFPNDSLKDCDAAIARTPKNADAYFFRSELHRAMGDHRRALADAERARDLGMNVDQRYLEVLAGEYPGGSAP